MTEMTKTARTETRDEQEQRAETRDEWEKTLQLIGVVGLSQLASDLADFGVMFEFLVRGAVLYYSSSRFPSIISYEIVYKFSIANCTNSLLSGFLVPPPTIYRRVASYEDPEDFRQDVREAQTTKLLLVMVRCIWWWSDDLTQHLFLGGSSFNLRLGLLLVVARCICSFNLGMGLVLVVICSSDLGLGLVLVVICSSGLRLGLVLVVVCSSDLGGAKPTRA
ncbi:hypothetical protein ACOSP7_006358 [Xanthoceras sorbifolium]